jgi:hypothetical protein
MNTDSPQKEKQDEMKKEAPFFTEQAAPLSNFYSNAKNSLQPLIDSMIQAGTKVMMTPPGKKTIKKG